VLVSAAMLYLGATLALIQALHVAPGRLGKVMRSESTQA
jgi:hypothetical protein